MSSNIIEMSNKALLFIFGLFLTVGFGNRAHSADKNKQVICTVTINSDDEKKVFSKNLNSKDFEFVELVPEDPKDNDWFENSCKSGLKCDVLIISGHFGGSFFGSSGKSLSLDTLEKQSCNNRCPGILGSPTEVFLFGCNTLASKEKDHRTPEQYLQVLLQDNIPRATAERIVESRYGAMGDSNRQRMKRVFENVPHIYGFDSVGPSGKNVKGLLQDYFKKSGDYKNYLIKERLKSSFETLEVLNKGLVPLQAKPNIALAQSLGTTTFNQCSGISSNEPEYEAKKAICELYDPDVSKVRKLALVESIISGPNRFSMLPAIEVFLKNNPSKDFDSAEMEIFNRIKANTTFREEVNTLIQNLNLPTLSINLAILAHQLDWLDEKHLAEVTQNAVRNLFSEQPMTGDTKDVLCSLATTTAIPLKNSDLPSKGYLDFNSARALYCLMPRDKELQKTLVKGVQEGVGYIASASSIVGNTVAKLANENLLYKEGQTDVSAMLRHPDDATRERYLKVLKQIKSLDPATYPDLVHALDDKFNDHRFEAMVILREAKPKDREVQLAIVKKLSDPYRAVRFNAQKALLEINPTDPEVLRKWKEAPPESSFSRED